jgi:hypothetical protein
MDIIKDGICFSIVSTKAHVEKIFSPVRDLNDWTGEENVDGKICVVTGGNEVS